MIRTFSTIAILAALAGPAAAQDITVNLSGKDARAADIAIERAAWAVCKDAYLKSNIERAELADCARSLAEDAMARADGRASPLAQAGAFRVLASNDSGAPPRR
jgi:hypothetical protein